MTTVIINPGSGPVSEGTRREADKNIRAFLRDVGFKRGEVTATFRRRGNDGRYWYTLRRRGKRTQVDIPGWPLERVKFLEGCNPWVFPRLYVDGSSWLWPFAVNCARDSLTYASEARSMRGTGSEGKP